MDSRIFLKLGNNYTRHKIGNSETVGRRRFISMFGVSAKICSILWGLIRLNLSEGSKPAHLLWALMFLKNYGIEESNRAILNADEKTIRKWVWNVIHSLSKLRVVNFYQI